MHSLVLSHLDYANALFYGLPDTTLAPLRRIQHRAAKLVLKLGRLDSATEALKTLHWLPITYRSEFKLACLAFQVLHGTAPQYLCDLLDIKVTDRTTRFALDGVKFKVPKTTRKTFADRSFSVGAAVVWNSLPNAVRSVQVYSKFKTSLKTYYFKKAFNV